MRLGCNGIYRGILAPCTCAALAGKREKCHGFGLVETGGGGENLIKLAMKWLDSIVQQGLQIWTGFCVRSLLGCQIGERVINMSGGDECELVCLSVRHVLIVVTSDRLSCTCHFRLIKWWQVCRLWFSLSRVTLPPPPTPSLVPPSSSTVV